MLPPAMATTLLPRRLKPFVIPRTKGIYSKFWTLGLGTIEGPATDPFEMMEVNHRCLLEQLDNSNVSANQPNSRYQPMRAWTVERCWHRREFFLETLEASGVDSSLPLNYAAFPFHGVKGEIGFGPWRTTCHRRSWERGKLFRG